MTAAPVTFRYRARAIDPDTGDLVTPLAFVYDEEAVRQRVLIRFKFFRGTWFLDLREGIPYFEEVLKKRPDPFVVASLMKRTILSTPGIVSVDSFELKPIAPSRVWDIRWSATTDVGKPAAYHNPRMRLDVAG